LLAQGGQKAREFEFLLSGDQIIDQGSDIEKAHAMPLTAGS
jgi:hypothetical protein